jgi:hemin uptake protein HemP
MKTLPTAAAVADSTAPADSAVPQTVTSGTHARPRQIRSTDLFGGRREILIEHSGELYSLRQTSKGKLILTK